jgi:hypothetical protein
VPRHEDIGFDFFCSLISQESGFLKAGPVFAVQAKSSPDPIHYRKPHEIEWLRSLENPLLLCVADRKGLAMDVYSTWNAMCGPLANGPHPITLLPGVARDSWPGVMHRDDGTQQIYLGSPIVRVTDADIFDDSRIGEIASVISEWVAFDRTNIVNRDAGMYWVQGPLAYETGQSPFTSGQRGTAVYWHPDNLSGCSRNLARVASAIALILRDFVPEADRTPAMAERDAALREILRTHWSLFEEADRILLRSQGLNFNPPKEGDV